FAATHKKGDKVTGKIKSITDFGVFIGLEGNIDGLIHLSDLSWNEEGEDVIRNYSKGDELEAVVLAVDPDRERISLGVKQLDQDPFSDFTAINDRGALVTGVIVNVEPKEAEIRLAEEVIGVLKASEISVDRVEDARNVLTVGEEVETKIVSIDRKNRTIGLSIKAKDIDDERQAVRDHRAQETERPGAATLGDLIKAQMNQDD
ncbi:MAG: S1 RNA-binding domain-containing protein, partial [Pseudomonadota bacterium]